MNALTIISVMLLASVHTNATTGEFPVTDQGGKIAIVCHRGYWNCEKGGMSENSIASLKAAQDYGFWGSECDVHVTADSVVIVNHNPDINGLKINEHKAEDLGGFLLPNGERRPTLDAYLDQTALCSTTKLIIELKIQACREYEDLLLEKTVESVRKHNLLNPERVIFITFSRYLSNRIAREYPDFTNQFITAEDLPENTPEKVAADRVNGIDYSKKLLLAHPEWVQSAHGMGMSVNVWTVNKQEDIVRLVEMGVDAITTNFPELVRSLLDDRELRPVNSPR